MTTAIVPLLLLFMVVFLTAAVFAAFFVIRHGWHSEAFLLLSAVGAMVSAVLGFLRLIVERDRGEGGVGAFLLLGGAAVMLGVAAVSKGLFTRRMDSRLSSDRAGITRLN